MLVPCDARVFVLLQEITFNIDGISLLEQGETPDDSLARELGEASFGSKYLSSNVLVPVSSGSRDGGEGGTFSASLLVFHEPAEDAREVPIPRVISNIGVLHPKPSGVYDILR